MYLDRIFFFFILIAQYIRIKKFINVVFVCILNVRKNKPFPLCVCVCVYVEFQCHLLWFCDFTTWSTTFSYSLIYSISIDIIIIWNKGKHFYVTILNWFFSIEQTTILDNWQIRIVEISSNIYFTKHLIINDLCHVFSNNQQA